MGRLVSPWHPLLVLTVISLAPLPVRAGELCAVLEQLLAEAPEGFPNARGTLVDADLGWYRCRLPIPGSTICKVEISVDPEYGDSRTLEHRWQQSDQDAALAAAEAMATEAEACDLGEFRAPAPEATGRRNRWSITAAWNESSRGGESLVVSFGTRVVERRNEYFTTMSVSHATWNEGE